MSKALRIAFMGTPEFAVTIASAIQQSQHELVGIVTVADKPAGRGQKVSESAVKQFAVAQDIPVLQPEKLKDSVFLADLAAWEADVFVVVAFRMLPKEVWAMPKMGTFNLHASLLPLYRGAAPINWAIINGESQTGVTSFFIDDKIDTGEMILQRHVDIAPDETAGQLHDRLAVLGAQTVVETLDLIAAGEVKTQPQDLVTEFKTAYKLNRENTKINWQADGQTIHNLIRGLSPYPAAWTNWYQGEQVASVKIYLSSFEKGQHTEAVGTVILEKKNLKVAVKDGYLHILELQLPGKKRLAAIDVINGLKGLESLRVD